jgi:hypothetical protein
MSIVRRRAVVLAAAIACVAATLTATPAQALTPPPWPTSGRIPTGCDNATPAGSGAGLTTTYTDSFTPLVVYAGFGPGPFAVVGPTGRRFTFVARTLQPCSGVDTVSIAVAVNGGPSVVQPGVTGYSTDAFQGWWHTPLATLRPSQAGRYVTTVETQRRYDSFVLDASDRLVSKTDTVAAPVPVSGGWATVSQFLLRQTTLTAHASAPRVAKGSPVTVSGHLNYALDRAWARGSGEKVSVLMRTPGTRWVGVVTLVADANGFVSYTFRPRGTTYIQFAHARTFTGRFTDRANTAAVRVLTG